MAEGLNRVMLLGNLGADPELRFTQGGQAVLNMRLATTESYLDKNKVRQERTDWHNVIVWGARGEALARILGKGSSILVEGSLHTSSYDDRDGNKRYKTEVVAREVILTGGRQHGAWEEGDRARSGSGVAHGGEDDAPPDRASAQAEGAGTPSEEALSPGGASSRGGGAGAARRGGRRGAGDHARGPAPVDAPAAAPLADEYAGDFSGGGVDDEIPF
jgi:single-strand DNA-binding protein